MIEAAVLIEDRSNRKAKYYYHAPVGSVIETITDLRRRRKWTETMCDLVSPAKREKNRSLPGWQAMCDAWSPSLRADWMDLERTKDRTREDDDLFWLTRIFPLGHLGDLPYVPESDKRIYEAWPWSEHEMKRLFLTVSNDTLDEEAVTWPVVVQSGVVPDMIRRRRKVLSYHTDIPEISAETRDKIDNPTILVRPRYDKPMAKARYADTAIPLIPAERVR